MKIAKGTCTCECHKNLRVIHFAPCCRATYLQFDNTEINKLLEIFEDKSTNPTLDNNS